MSDSHERQARVLVVDDQPTMRFFATEILSRAGFVIQEAEDGLQALDCVKQQMPDCILLDVMMPEMDGFAACEAIRKLPYGAHVPVLMMTGMDDEQSIMRAYDAGATDFISKPISRAVLSISSHVSKCSVCGNCTIFLSGKRSSTNLRKEWCCG